MLTIAFVYLAADFLGPEIRERGWGFFRNSDYGVSSDVWWKKGGTWEPRRRHVWREYFWQTVWGILFLSITRLITYFPVAYPDPLRCDMIPLSIRPPKQPIIDFIINIGRAAVPPSPSQAKHTFRDKLQDP